MATVPKSLPPPAPPPRRGSESAPRRSLEELDPGTLARCRSRDPIAMRAFVVRYERPVFALLSRLLGAGPHVDDLAQETFLKAFRALPGFDPAHAARPSTWLLTIATRLALDARKRRTVPSFPLEAASGVPDALTPETERARQELGRAIEAAAASLTDEQRAAFVLVELHDLSMAEAAHALGVPENTVKSRLFRAREQLRERLATSYREAADGSE